MSLTTEQEYEVTTAIIGSVTSLRKFAKEKDLSWLKATHEKFEAIIKEREEEEEILELERQEKEQMQQKLLDVAATMGLDPATISFDDDAKTNKKKKKSSKVTQPKYRFIDPLTGKEDTYSGQGRMKKGLKALLDKGHSLDEFLIDKNEHQ
ncbi:TPA: H-NS family nucleoid-associated regulatory protein [Providencia alcalifaciens]